MIKKSATVPLQYDTDFSPFGKFEFDYALAWLTDNGFNGIEIPIFRPREVNAKELLTKLSGFELVVSAISTGQARVLDGVSLTDEAEADRKAAVYRFKEFIDLASEIGFPPVTIGLIRGGERCTDTGKKMDVLEDSMLQCLSYACDKRVRLMIEPINRYETKIINSFEEALAFLDRLGNPENLGLLYDTFHSNIEDKDMLEAIRKAGEKIMHVHFADSDRGLPGEGHICFSEIINALKKIRYSGYISLETLNMPDKASVINGAGRSFARLGL